MKKPITIIYLLLFYTSAISDTIVKNNILNDSLFLEKIKVNNKNLENRSNNIFIKRLDSLDNVSPMDLQYNKKVQPFIDNYINRNKKLISKMQSLSEYYFSIFEVFLDKYNLPLELKYLTILESALNPKAKSPSGATGLWQFMYLTGKQYNLNVNSYIDERQDPIKSTEAACRYFIDLYEIFGDWNLVLAAYNGGPGYIQRKIKQHNITDFWSLAPHLRKETRDYVPTFIAVNYIMNYSKEHKIEPEISKISFKRTDTLVLKQQITLDVLKELTCLNDETINYLNPSYKKEIYTRGAKIVLPLESREDFLLNEKSNYLFVERVNKKEVLINEERINYIVQQDDYLGRIAKEFNVHVFEIKEWNDLMTSKIETGEKLILYVKKNNIKNTHNHKNYKEYIIQKGDTLWDIAKKHNNLSIWKIKSLNNLENNFLKPGTKIILPTS